jgi:DNA-binding Lrp family transcriptional regulator
LEGSELLSKNHGSGVDLDEIDLGIINVLLKDGTKNLSEIASALKVGIATVHRRLRRLKEEGVVEGYTLLVNLKKLGLNVIAIIELKIEVDKEESIQKEIEKVNAITEIYKISGEYDISIKVKASDLDNLNNILRRIKNIKGVEGMNTKIVLDVIRDSRIYPIVTGGSQ